MYVYMCMQGSRPGWAVQQALANQAILFALSGNITNQTRLESDSK